MRDRFIVVHTYIIYHNISYHTYVGPLTEFAHNSYGTDYINVPTSRAHKISEPLNFSALYKHVFTRNFIEFDHYYSQKWYSQKF